MYVEDDINSANAITPMHFLNIKPKIGTPVITKDDGKRYQSKLKGARVQSHVTPKIGQIVHLKEDLPRGAWRMGKITKLIKSQDKEIRATKVLLPTGNEVNGPINLLYPLETVTPLENADEDRTHQDVTRPNDVGKANGDMVARPKRRAADIARNKFKALYTDNIGTFVWCWECSDFHEK